MTKKNASIQFHFPCPLNLPNRGILKGFIGTIFKKENTRFEKVDIIFCNDRYLLTLNQEFLKHDFYTDILSFPLSSPGEPLVAEIYISCDRVRENAKNLDSSLKEELHRVIFHGILHFCGYKDMTSADIKKMRAREDKYLKDFFRLKAKSPKPKTLSI